MTVPTLPFPRHDVRAIAIRTNDRGPFEEDVFWLFDTPSGEVEVPGSTLNGAQALTLAAGLGNVAFTGSVGGSTHHRAPSCGGSIASRRAHSGRRSRRGGARNVSSSNQLSVRSW